MTAEEKEIMQDVLCFYLPQYEVRGFGSRVHGRHLKKFSDLDLVVMTREKLPAKDWARVKDAFSLSDLPFRVDVVDWAAISEKFRKIIEDENEVIHTPLPNK